ncbi:hypothetical protein PC129_g22712 [Phytophthora cactorum]|uniref:Uncharacterized protein n=1 Tax=Phytophthora cactorum TaxID=29920 RepID=A0A329R8M2_9STRA|nr:hypothetical protein Pcac1_g17275 [Phytophthora cactorum]KAG2873435.1 hypothetical protein PC114_g25853 [Phytophthora cactorum]KAG2885354.1 hypothetical protein PC117_g25611 [Phytophthora cactorum]KAG2963960.1 hypothetical protein PC119_g25366 [Phytophthora cactorum]KAG2968026.1 hypothetical protein PC118_g18259 [Phytophthora cactorum]
MLQRYHRISPQIKTVEAVEELEPTGPSHRKFLVLLEPMKKFQSVSKKLQCDTIDLADVRLLFDSVVEGYPCMRDQLKPNAKIVHFLVLGRLSSKLSTEVLWRMQRQRRSRGSRSQDVRVRGRHAKRTTRLKFSSQEQVSALRWWKCRWHLV